MEENLIRDSFWMPKVEEWQTKQYTCVRCGMGFYEAKNIGSWSCWQHPHYPPVQPGEVWPCCNMLCKKGRTGSKPGCVRADHTTLLLPFDDSHDYPIPKVIAEQILKRRFREDAIVRPGSLQDTETYSNPDERAEADSYVTVRRYQR